MDEEDDVLQNDDNLWNQLIAKIVASVANLCFWFQDSSTSDESNCDTSTEYNHEHLKKALEELKCMTKELKLRADTTSCSASKCATVQPNAVLMQNAATSTEPVQIAQRNTGTDLSYPVCTEFSNASTQGSKTNLQDKQLQSTPESQNTFTQKSIPSENQVPLQLIASEMERCNTDLCNNPEININRLQVTKLDNQQQQDFVLPKAESNSKLKTSRSSKLKMARVSKKQSTKAANESDKPEASEVSETSEVQKPSKENDVDSCLYANQLGQSYSQSLYNLGYDYRNYDQYLQPNINHTDQYPGGSFNMNNYEQQMYRAQQQQPQRHQQQQNLDSLNYPDNYSEEGYRNLVMKARANVTFANQYSSSYPPNEWIMPPAAPMASPNSGGYFFAPPNMPYGGTTASESSDRELCRPDCCPDDDSEYSDIDEQNEGYDDDDVDDNNTDRRYDRLR